MEREFKEGTNFPVTLTNCDKEPIHILGYTQPCGFVFVLDSNEEVIAVSDNVIQHTGFTAEYYWNKGVRDFLHGFPSLHDIKVNEPELFYARFTTNPDGVISTIACCHRNSQGFYILELEKPLHHTQVAGSAGKLEDISWGFDGRLQPLFQRISEFGGRNKEDLLDQTSEHIQKLTGFDSVMIYEFDEDWCGTVVVEKSKFGMRFLGLKFPSTDIPMQARNLYLLNRVRSVAGVNLNACKLRPKDKETPAIDLSFSLSRAVSPIHVQYLKNMGVEASMSVSIVVGGKLWGLISCHNYSPVFISFCLHKTLDIIGRILSTHVENIIRREIVYEQAMTERLFTQLREKTLSADGKSPLISSLMNFLLSEDIQALVKFDGLSVICEGKIVSVGQVSSRAEEMAQWIANNTCGKMFLCRNVVKIMNIPTHDGLSCGLLKLEVFPQVYVVFHRSEEILEINWAGKSERNSEGLLIPRRSFAIWQETARNRCKAWTQKDQETANRLMDTLNAFCLGWNSSKERKVAEEQKRLKEKLLRDREVALKSAAVKNNFLANITHELRTPLHAIIANSDYLSNTLGSGNELSDCTKAIQSSSEHLLSLINEILDFSKIEANKMEISTAPFDFLKDLEELMESMNVLASKKSLYMNLLVCMKIPGTLKGDSTRLNQILLNFISNAIKFTHTGGVTLKVELDKLEETCIELVLKVIDTGIGIPPDQVHHLFERFTQLDAGPTRMFEGTGLGLSISKQLAGLMGGEVGVTSTLGSGSCFFVQLPLEVIKSDPIYVPNSELRNQICITWEHRPFVKDFLLFHLRQADLTCEVIEDDVIDWDARMTNPHFIFFNSCFADKINEAFVRSASRPALIALDALEDKFDWSLNSPFKVSELIAILNNIHKINPNHNPKSPVNVGRSLSVLLVEDNVPNQVIACRFIRKLGHDVEVAQNGLIALKLLESKRYDVVLMDVMMPEMDGLTATIEIRKRETATGLHTPIMGLTASSGKEKLECIKVGMDSCLSKPFKFEDLQKEISETVLKFGLDKQ